MVASTAPYQKVGFTFTLPAAGDLSAQQYTAMQVSSAGLATTATAATQNAIGILLNTASAAGQEALIGCFGIYLVRAGAAFAEGAVLTADADGELIATTTDGDCAIAIALAEATTADEIVPALVGPFGRTFVA